MIGFPSFRPSSKKRQDRENGGKLATRKSPHYHNTLLEAPDGQPLCVCATGKAEWYISKGLGVKVKDDPLTVRLNFEPSGRPEGEAGEYYLTVKAESLALKHGSRILGHSPNPVCGFSMQG